MTAKWERKPPSFMTGSKPEPGTIRVYVSPGGHLAPQPFDRFSSDGHAWSVLDIPVELYEEVTGAIKEYLRTQALLREYMDSHQRFCSCGSNHADIRPDYD